MSIGQQLDRIEVAGLVRVAQIEPELEYVFRHALIQDTAYGTMVTTQRREIHAAVARALEFLYPDRGDELAPMLAYHFDNAGDNEQALKYLTRAGDLAANRYAHAEAVIHYRRAIDIAGQIQADSATIRRLYLAQGRTHQLSGGHDEALTTYLGLELVARERGDKPLELEALMAQATVYAMLTQQANPTESIRLSEQALAIAREIPDESAQSKILWNLSLAHWRKMELPLALGFSEQSLEIARRLNLREQMAYTLHDMGRCLLLLGRRADAALIQAEAEALWRELGNLPMLADSLNLKTTILYVGSDYSGARLAAEGALRLSRETGNWWGQAMSLRALGTAARESGELAAALEIEMNAMEASDQAGFVLGSLTSRGGLIDLYDYIGQFALADDVLTDLGKLAQDNSDPLVQAGMALSTAIHAQRGGDPDPARALLGISRQWPRIGPAHVPQIIDFRRIEMAYDLGEYGEVIGIAEPLLLETRMLLSQTETSKLARYKALAFMALGQLPEAREALDQAFALIAHESIRFQRWENLLALAELERKEGDSAEAQVHIAQARDAFEYLAARIHNPEFEASFRARPEVAHLIAISDT